MLQIVYGRERVDKEEFLFGEISKTLSSIGIEGNPQRIVLLVPDQYTLQAERNAFYYLGKKGFIDLEVLSQNRLAGKILAETGGDRRVRIDKNGRHMMLSKILKEQDKNLSVFRGMWRSQSFIAMTNDLISDMKQYDTDVSALAEVIDEVGPKTLLGRKLEDIRIIFSSYEEQIRGKYVDSEDYMESFITAIGRSSMLSETEVWIYGFDFFAPKMRKIIQNLVTQSKGVHVLLTVDDDMAEQELFELTKTMMDKLSRLTKKENISYKKLEEPVVKRSEPIAHIEKELYSIDPSIFSNESKQITLCKAANIYAEAETAAAYISSLVREEGLRFRDIAVICNDMEGIGPIIQRVFTEYEIPFFLDRKRKILHDPAIVFVSALLDVITEGWQYQDIFRLLKTGFCGVDTDEWEILENYVIRYRIRKNQWQKEFRYGMGDFGEDGLSACNRSREALKEFVGDLEERLKDTRTANDKLSAIMGFLVDKADLQRHIEELAEKLEEEGYFEAALEMLQVWEAIELLFAQLAELLEDEEIEDEDLAAMLKAGFSSFEVGIIPPTVDQVVVGAMQRIRIGGIQALVVIGANEGILPARPAGDDLLSQDERAKLLARAVELCRDDDLRTMEERLAIYRNLSKPESLLWIGCSNTDIEGKDLHPSILFERLRMLFPNAPVEKDLRNQEDPMALIQRPAGTLKHLTEALRQAYAAEGDVPLPLMAAFNWYKDVEDPRLAIVNRGLLFDNRLEKLEVTLADKLFRRGDADYLTLTPSRLERFGRCPFSHLVMYGFRPEERRVFELAAREAGDVYHECVMRFAKDLTIKGVPLNKEESPWMSISKETCQDKIAAIMEQIAEEYKEGILTAGPAERYRSDRMKKICGKAAWAMVEHVRLGKIQEMYFEESFGEAPDKEFPPIRINVGDQEIRIEGKIDRMDILPGDYVKIIDYKSGKERFDSREAIAGWRLQLMLYLKAATLGFAEKDQPMKPAGIFYFEIGDNLVDVSTVSEKDLTSKLISELKKAFRMDGILVDDEAVIENIAGEFAGYSEIVPLRKTKEGKVSGTSEANLLSEEAFLSLRNAVDQTVTTLCSSLASGVIDVHPKKTRYQTACTYCEYKSICNFELSFDGCSYEIVK